MMKNRQKQAAIQTLNTSNTCVEAGKHQYLSQQTPVSDTLNTSAWHDKHQPPSAFPTPAGKRIHNSTINPAQDLHTSMKRRNRKQHQEKLRTGIVPF